MAATNSARFGKTLPGEKPLSTEQTDRFTDVWSEVSGWPDAARRSLASRILESLDEPQTAERRATPTNLIGVWKRGQPPNDEEVEQIVEEEKMRKYE
jgi:hypothetical protein